jgi:hypothetical protein
MAIRINTVVFTFDLSSPRITAHDLHEWLHAELRIQEKKTQMIQIDGIKRQVYVKLSKKYYMLSIINGTRGRGAYKHHTGEISPVKVAVARMSYKKILVANLPPEVLDDTLRDALAPFGQVSNI